MNNNDVNKPVSLVEWQNIRVTPQQRADLLHQKPRCIWLTGLSGAGKSTIASALDAKLYEYGRKSFLLDGDNLRHGLNKDLGMSESDRSENIRRAGEVAKLFFDAGLIVICAFISPYKRDRQTVRSMFEKESFIEVFLDTPLKICESRDPKGLYKKAREGTIKNFTGISAPYEEPQTPELKLDTSLYSIEDCTTKVMNKLGLETENSI